MEIVQYTGKKDKASVPRYRSTWEFPSQEENAKHLSSLDDIPIYDRFFPYQPLFPVLFWLGYFKHLKSTCTRKLSLRKENVVSVVHS